ncbi:TVP38/TMEM64 family protein [bacterium]|nr:TVP38/TMEM64 family protein [bacterium]
MSKKIGALSALLIGIFLYLNYGLGTYFSFDIIKSKTFEFQSFVDSNLWTSTIFFFAIYALSNTLYLPIASVLTLAGGALFGFWHSLILVSFASSVGATGAFLLSRYFLKSYVEKNFGKKLSSIQEGVEQEGGFYLFSLRLVPAFPFWMINLLSGVSNIKTVSFYWVSQLGMLPGTAVYVNAGTRLAELDSASGLLSVEMIFSFTALGLLPLLSKKLLLGIKQYRR